MPLRHGVGSATFRCLNVLDESCGSIGKIHKRIDSHNDRIIIIETVIPGIQGDITNIQGDITTIQGGITTIQGDITTIQGDITTIQGDITTITTDVTTIQGDITTITTDITTIQGDITTITTDITTIQGDITIIQGDITTINNIITGGNLGGTIIYETSNLITPALSAGSALVSGATNNILLGANTGDSLTNHKENICIGLNSARDATGLYRNICIGVDSHYNGGYYGSVAIGYRAGYNGTGNSSICIGTRAGENSAHNKTIVLNANETALNADKSGAFYVKPIKNNINDNVLYYNHVSGEITYDNPATENIISASFDIGGDTHDVLFYPTKDNNALNHVYNASQWGEGGFIKYIYTMTIPINVQNIIVHYEVYSRSIHDHDFTIDVVRVTHDVYTGIETTDIPTIGSTTIIASPGRQTGNFTFSYIPTDVETITLRISYTDPNAHGSEVITCTANIIGRI
jgi:hypothetical protein